MFRKGAAKGVLKKHRGQTLVLMALGMLVFMGFVALSVDGGMILSTRRRAQAAADSAALAAAYARIRNEDWQQRAWDVASDNGFDAAQGDVIQVTCETATGAPCPPVWNNDEEYIRVAITAARQTSFAQLLTDADLKTTVEAIARVRLNKRPLFGSDAFVALAPHGSGGLNGGIKLNSNSVVIVHNGGMFSNSDHSTKSIWGLATSRIYLDSSQTLKAVGGMKLSHVMVNGMDMSCDLGLGWLPATMPMGCTPKMSPIPFPPTDYLHQRVPPMPSPPACTDHVSRLTMNGGTLGTPGGHKVYCVNGDVDLNNVDIKGHVTFVITKQNADVELDSDMNIDSLDIFMHDGEVKFKAGCDLHADHMHVYADGDADINILGNTKVKIEDTLFYLMEGRVDWNGNAEVKFCGPPKNDPHGFGGLTMYMVHYNGSPDLHIHGNTNNWIAGTVLAPYASVIYNGNSNNTYSAASCHGISDPEGYPSQVIAYAIKFNGNTYTRVDFNPDLIYTADAPVVEMLK